MKNRVFLVTLAVTLGTSLVPLTRASVIYSTFGPGNTFDTNHFVRVGGGLPGPPGTDAFADEFTSPVTANVGSVSLALNTAFAIPAITLGPDFIVAIHSNSPTGPGGILGTFTSQVVPTGPGIFTFDASTEIQLVAGTEYWLSIASPSVVGTAADWFLNNQGIDNTLARRQSGKWTVDGNSTALAFSVSTVPEPGSAALCTVAIAAAYLRRKRNASVRS